VLDDFRLASKSVLTTSSDQSRIKKLIGSKISRYLSYTVGAVQLVLGYAVTGFAFETS